MADLFDRIGIKSPKSAPGGDLFERLQPNERKVAIDILNQDPKFRSKAATAQSSPNLFPDKPAAQPNAPPVSNGFSRGILDKTVGAAPTVAPRSVLGEMLNTGAPVETLKAPVDTWTDTARKAAQRAPALVKGAIGGAIQGLVETAPEQIRSGVTGGAIGLVGKMLDVTGVLKLIEDVNTGARAAGTLPGQALSKEAAEDLATNGYNPGDSTGKYYAGMLADSLVLMAPAVAASFATRNPTVAGAVMGGLVAGQQFSDSRESGRTVEQAAIDATWMGVSETIAQSTPLGILMKPGGKFLARGMKAAGAEAAQEVVTQILQTGYEMAVLRPDMTWGEAVNSVRDAAIVGGLMGGTLSVATAPFTRGINERPQPATLGIREASAAQAAILTPDDEASPIPNEMIASGKARVAAATSTVDADAILTANAAPKVGSRITVRAPDGTEVSGIVDDAFVTDGGAAGSAPGITIKLDNGGRIHEHLDTLTEAGVTLVLLSPLQQAAQADTELQAMADGVGATPTVADVADVAPAQADQGKRGAPVADGRAVTESLFPGVRVTSNYRDPNDPLSKANPKSWHTKSRGAVDVAPIKGMTFEQYVQRYRDAGYSIIEAKNEVGAGRSAWATGDHWHVVIGKKGSQSTASTLQVSAVSNGEAVAESTTAEPEAPQVEQPLVAEQSATTEPDSLASDAVAPDAVAAEVQSSANPTSSPNARESETRDGLLFRPLRNDDEYDALRSEAEPVNDIRGNPTGWLQVRLPNGDGTSLVHPTDKTIRQFTGKGWRQYAPAYAIDNPVETPSALSSSDSAATASSTPTSRATVSDMPSGKSIIITGASAVELAAIREAIPNALPLEPKSGGVIYSAKYRSKITETLDAITQKNTLPHDGKARKKQDGRVSDLERDQAAVPVSQQERISEIRGSGDNAAPRVGGELSGVSGLRRSATDAETYNRPDRRDEGLRAGERALGDSYSAESEQARLGSATDAQRSDNADDRLGARVGSDGADARVPPQSRDDGGENTQPDPASETGVARADTARQNDDVSGMVGRNRPQTNNNSQPDSARMDGRAITDRFSARLGPLAAEPVAREGRTAGEDRADSPASPALSDDSAEAVQRRLNRNEEIRRGLAGEGPLIEPTEPASTTPAPPVAADATSTGARDEERAPVSSTDGPSAADVGEPISANESNREDTAVTASGRSVLVRYAVVSAGDLIASNDKNGNVNPNYPSALQPRDRSRAVSQTQIADLAANLNPVLLGPSPKASDGAPIIASDGVVESGNGRTLAIQRAYAMGSAKAKAYRAYISEQGFDTAGIKRPVLVRIRIDPMTADERTAFTREANARDTLGYSSTEQAASDAAALTSGTLDLYRGGDLDSAGNRDFVRAFLKSVVTPNDYAAMVSADGSMSQSAIARVRGALLSRAYGNANIVAQATEATDSDIKTIIGAMTDVAGRWAQMVEAAKEGQIDPALDLTSHLNEAVALVDRARREGRAVRDLVGQQDIFAGSMSPLSEGVLRLFFANNDFTRPTGRARIATAFNFVIDEAMKSAPGGGLFGEETKASPDAIVALAKERQDDGSPLRQSDLLDQSDGSANQSGSPDIGGRASATRIDDGRSGRSEVSQRSGDEARSDVAEQAPELAETAGPEYGSSDADADPALTQPDGTPREGGSGDDRATGSDDTSVRGADASLPRGGNDRVRALGIAADLRREGTQALVGREAANPRDLAELAQVYRDPRHETFRVFFMKGDTIVHTSAVSARMSDATPLMPKDANEEFAPWLRETMATAGADSYYLMHNHPSGDPTPSLADRKATAQIARAVPGMRAHVIINSNRYATINDQGGPKVRDLDLGEDRLLAASKPDPVLGKIIMSSAELALHGKALQRPGYVTVIGTGPRGAVRVVADYPIAELARAKIILLGAMRRLKRQSGSSNLFLVGERADLDNANVRGAFQNNVLTDAIDTTGRLLSNTTGRLGSDPPLPMTAFAARFVAENRKAYIPGPFARAEDSASRADEDVTIEMVETLSTSDPSTVAGGSAFDRFRTKMQDRMLPMLRVQQAIETATGKPLDESENPYIGEELMSGRVGSALETLSDNMVEPLFGALKEEGITKEELESYLYARHAPERNARISEINPEFAEDEGSGMTDAEAADIMDAVEQSGQAEGLARLAQRIDELVAFSLDTRVEAGLLSKKEALTWRKTYASYVPLRGRGDLDAETSNPARPMKGSGISVKGKESRRAFGRKSRAGDIIAYTVMAAEEAIIRAETNRVGKQFHDLAKANPDPDFWKIDKITRKPLWDSATNSVVYQNQARIAAEDADYTVTLKIEGVEHRVTMNRDNPAAVRVADAMRNLSAQQLQPLVKFVGTFTRIFSRINTSLVPEFVISNAVRDIQAAGVNLQQYDMKGLDRGMVRDWRKALTASKNGDGEWNVWRREFEASGGKMYFMGLSDLNSIKDRIDVLAKRGDNASIKTAVMTVFKTINKINDRVENAVRLSAYANARKLGMTETQAASLARNVTVNFTRRGQYGPAFNSLYAFFNASVQGSTTLVRAAARSKKVRMALVGMVALGFALDMLNRWAGDDDEDGQSYWEKIPAFEKSRNFIIMLPGMGDRNIKLPVGLGINAFFSLGRNLSEIVHGADPLTAGMEAATNMLGAFNPLGSNTLLGMAAPTIADPFLEVSLNRNFADRQIQPEPSPFETPKPASENYFPSVSTISRKSAEWINALTGGDDVIKGAVSVSPEVLDYTFAFVTGGVGRFIGSLGSLATAPFDPERTITSADIPFVRKLTGTKPEWLDKSLFYDRIKQVEEAVDNAEQYEKSGRTEAFAAYAKRNETVMSLESETKAARKEMRGIRKAKHENDAQLSKNLIDDATHRAEADVLKKAELLVATEFNTRWNETVLPAKGD